MNTKISIEELLTLFNANAIGVGNYGKIIKISDDIVYKIYYKDLWDICINEDKDEIKKQLKIKMNNEESVFIKNSLFERVEALSVTKSNVIKSVITCEDYPVGVVMENLSLYKRMDDIYNLLSIEEKRIILYKIKKIVMELNENDISLFDFKMDNIMIDSDNLEVKLIDLDGETTTINNVKKDMIYDENMTTIQNKIEQTL